MPRLRYDFSNLVSLFDNALARGKMNSTDLMNIRKELNKFFNDSTCTQVYYTDNTDKMFFGILVNVNVDPGSVYDYLMGDDSVRLSRYSLEYDSHLFNSVLALTGKELLALTLHEVGHVVNDSTPIYNARKYLDEYMARTGETISMADSYHYKEILAHALRDFIAKDRSIFYTTDVDEVLADDFVRSYGLGASLERAMKKIINSNMKLYTNSQNVDKFASLMWALDIYRHLGTRRVPAIKTLRRAMALTGSRIEKMEYDNLIKRISRIDDFALQEASNKGVLNSKIKQRMRKMRFDNMRSLEDDYYELNMRIQNVEDEDDALYLMRQLNTRISIIQDFINSEDLSKDEVKRWNESLDRFRRLRSKLSDTVVYKGKAYGLYVPYPEIKPDNY